MPGNQLFGIFSPEKLKKVIPPHRAPGVQGGAQMWGNQLFGISRLEKLTKMIPPHRAPGVQGGAQMRGNQLFGSALKSSKRCTGLQGSREEPRCGRISFSAFSALKSSKR